MEKEGQFQGASYEICEEIMQQTGLQMNFIGYDNTQELVQALTSKEIDAAAIIGEGKDYWNNVSQIHYYDTLASCLNNIENEKADYTIHNL